MKIWIPEETAEQKRRLSEAHRDYLLGVLESLPPGEARKWLTEVKENAKTLPLALTRPEKHVYDTKVG